MIHSPRDNVICRMKRNIPPTNNVVNNNLSKKYIDDIKNMVYLDDKKIDNIKNMNDEEKMKIIIEFNNAIKSFFDTTKYHQLR